MRGVGPAPRSLLEVIVVLSLLLAASLSPVKEIPLAFNPGQVAYLLALPGGLLLSTCDAIQVPRASSDCKLFLLSGDGRVKKEQLLPHLGIEAPTNPVWGGEGVFLGDLRKGVVLTLDSHLQRRSEHLLKGSHPHPWYPRYLAAQEGRLFVTGCSPLRGYLDMGCLQVHEFVGEALRYQGSSLESEPIDQVWGSRPLSWQWVIGVSPRGELWVVEEAAGRGYRRPLSGSTWESLNFGAYAFKPPPYPKRAQEEMATQLRAAFLAAVIAFLADGNVAVAYARQKENDSHVIVFSPQGKAFAKLPLRGRVVGQVDGLVVTAERAGSWKLVFYRWDGGR